MSREFYNMFFGSELVTTTNYGKLMRGVEIVRVLERSPVRHVTSTTEVSVPVLCVVAVPLDNVR
jgi:hypothetical protein